MSIKILALGDSPTAATGYGRVMRELATAWSHAGFDVRVIGRGYNNEKHQLPFTIVGHAPADRFATEPLKQELQSWHPDILFTLGDIWMLDFVPTLTLRSTFRWVCYFPFDGVPIPLKWHGIIRNIDHPVMFSKFSLELLQTVEGVKPATLIYHGVDAETFYPLPQRDKLKQQAKLDDKFIVGCVARNQPRKNLAALVRTFQRFAADKEDVGLYLHTTMNDIGWDIPELLQRFHMTERTYLSNGMNDASCSVPDATLNKIYNLFDVFALPTCGEGFGLPILEAQSCGVPVLVTDYSACPELVVDPARELIDVKTYMVMNHQCIDQALVDEDDMLAKLNFFYADWQQGAPVGRALGDAGRALAERMRWSTFTQDFVAYMQEVAATVPPAATRNYNVFRRL